VNWTSRLSHRALRTVLASAIGLSAAALVWLGYRAVGEWQHAAALVAERRADAAVDLLVSALSRDMRGAHMSVLAAADREQRSASSADLLHPIASAFARYPYAEAFFSWRDQPDAGVVFYSRTERRPTWLSGSGPRALYPVVTATAPAVGDEILSHVRKDASQGRRFSAFTMPIEGADYQVSAVISYGDPVGGLPATITGSLVNLPWARAHYFADLAAQVASIEGTDGSVRFTILDEEERTVVGGPVAGNAPASRRMFPVAFFDPEAVAVDPPVGLQMQWWTAIATTGGDPTLAAAERGARRTLAIAAVMSLTLAIGLIVSLRAARASANLATMRADFVSAITHELKTPIGNMRAISETLASGRTTPETTREYAQMGIGEATRLTRLVDNLLAYSRVTDVADVYTFERVSVKQIVQRSLQEFGPNLRHAQFEVVVDVPDDLPPVHADPNAIGLLLNNLIDNAIRYSATQRFLSITAREARAGVTIEVADRGIGIAADELDRVTRKFFRGRTSVAGGSGLGLAIVDRIVSDHRGTLSIRSTEGQGTTVSVTIPAADR
jgi:signal transduction histidine kinase